MVTQISREVQPGMWFPVVSSMPGELSPCIVVPIRHIQGLQPAAIGTLVSACLELGPFVKALAIADWLYGNADGMGLSDFDEYAEDIALLEQYAEDDTAIALTLAKIHQIRARLERRVAGRKTVRATRQALQRQYDTIFVKIGRRDGFQCQGCAKTTDLQIEPVHPVIEGGTNDLGNLQLLCGTCNRKKSDRSVEDAHS